VQVGLCLYVVEMRCVRGGQLADGGDMSQTFCGSKAYAAPEILQGRTYDPMKADVWALGVIMYIFITGKMPFDETKVRPSAIRPCRTNSHRPTAIFNSVEHYTYRHLRTE